MAHLSAPEGYRRLIVRPNRFPQGAPLSDSLYRILEILFSPREAELVALLPIKPFSVATAAKAWAVPLAEAASLSSASPRAQSCSTSSTTAYRRRWLASSSSR